ncbi:MAG: biopolymer transporter ExbD [Rhodocyclaceae bacterium]|nr:MAG: biopolymer transporter ExbD [Rhodocyclaceae bacterium]
MQVQSETKPYDSINVTPMLDLAYVLLVIFIIMTTASVQGLSINLPKPSNKPSLEKKDVKVIQVLPDGSLHLNGAGVTADELEAQLRAAKAKDPEVPVVLKGDARVPYERVVAVLDLTGRIGIGSVGLVTAKIGN